MNFNFWLSFKRGLSHHRDNWENRMSMTSLIGLKSGIVCIVLQCVLLFGTAQGQNVRFDIGSNVILVGDSFTNGSTEWARRVDLSSEFSLDFFSEGGRSLNAIDGLFSEQYQADTYDAVVVAAGVNDVIADRSVDQIQTSIENIIAQANDEHIILTTIAPFQGLTNNWTQARQDTADQIDSWILLAAAASDQISVFDIRSILDTDDDQVIDAAVSIGDGLHPSICDLGDECGSEVIANAFVSQFSVAAVPEPGCVTVFASLGILVLGRRRR